MSFLSGGFSSLIWQCILWQGPRKKTKCSQVPPALMSSAATLPSVAHHRQKMYIWKERESERSKLTSAQASMREIVISLYHWVFILEITISPLSEGLYFSDFLEIFLFPENRPFPNRPSNRTAWSFFRMGAIRVPCHSASNLMASIIPSDQEGI